MEMIVAYSARRGSFSEHRGVPLAVPGALGDPIRGINRPGSQSPGVRESECPKWCQTHLGDSAQMPKWFENHRHSLHWLVIGCTVFRYLEPRKEVIQTLLQLLFLQ